MSIKVYEAYRIVDGTDPFELLWDLKRLGQQEAQAKLKKLYEDVLSGRAQKEAERFERMGNLFREWLLAQGHDPEKTEGLMSLYFKWSTTECPEEVKRPAESVIAVKNEALAKTALDPNNIGVFDVDRWAHNNYGEQLSSMSRNPWNLNVSITMRKYEGVFYLLPHCDPACYVKGCLDFLRSREELEDFAYWNNTDKPEEVSAAQWEKRASVWNHLTDINHWSNYVSLDIVSWLGWHEVSPMLEIARANGAKS